MDDRRRKIRVVREARRVLIDSGWTRNVAEDNFGRHCLIGALAKADNNLGGHHGLDVADDVRRLLPIPTENITYFNDYMADDMQDVLDLLDAVESLYRSNP